MIVTITNEFYAVNGRPAFKFDRKDMNLTAALAVVEQRVQTTLETTQFEDEDSRTEAQLAANCYTVMVDGGAPHEVVMVAGMWRATGFNPDNIKVYMGRDIVLRPAA